MTRCEYGKCPARRITCSSAGPLRLLGGKVAALGSRLLHMCVVGTYSCLSLAGLTVLTILIKTSIIIMVSVSLAMVSPPRWLCLFGAALLRNQYLKDEQ